VSWGWMGLVRVLCHIVGVRASGMLSPVSILLRGLFPLPRPVLLDYVINRIITRLCESKGVSNRSSKHCLGVRLNGHGGAGS
jgi:hypothetical protein